MAVILKTVPDFFSRTLVRLSRNLVWNIGATIRY